MDGPRAQAGKALGPQCPSAGRRERSLLAHRREDRAAVERQVRDHARHRHAVAARGRAAVRRRDGAPAEPRAFRWQGQAHQGQDGDRRVWDPAAARGYQPGGRESLVVRAPARRRSGNRPLYACRVRRLPGRIPRGIFHRQGDLRRRCVRAGAERPLSGEQDPESRPHRGLLRPVGAPERRAVVRRISVDLQRRHGSPPPVDSRRLAARWLAPAARSRPRPAPGQESAVRAFPLEALRQPAAEPRPRGAHAPSPARMDRASACLVVDAGGARGSAAAIGLRLHRAVVDEGGRRAAATAPRRHRQRCGPRRRANGADACLPALRGDGQSRCDRADRVADARDAPAAARMESVGPGRPRSPPRRGHRGRTPSLRTCGVGPVDVDRPADRRG